MLTWRRWEDAMQSTPRPQGCLGCSAWLASVTHIVLPPAAAPCWHARLWSPSTLLADRPRSLRRARPACPSGSWR